MKKYTIQVSRIGKPLYIKGRLYQWSNKTTYSIEEAYFTGDLDEIVKLNGKVHGKIVVFDEDLEELYFLQETSNEGFLNKLRRAKEKYDNEKQKNHRGSDGTDDERMQRM